MKKVAENEVRDSGWLRDDVVSAANSVQADFARLVEIFEQQLRAAANEDDPTFAGIADAKRAAEQGLLLSSAFVNAVSPSIEQASRRAQT